MAGSSILDLRLFPVTVAKILQKKLLAVGNLFLCDDCGLHEMMMRHTKDHSFVWPVFHLKARNLGLGHRLAVNYCRTS